MNLLLLFSNLDEAVGGIPHYNRLLVQALQTLSAENGISLRVLALHDRPSKRGSPEFSYEGFGGKRWAFARASVAAGRASDIVVLGHAHFTPLALAMPRVRTILVAHGIDVWDRLSIPRRLGLGRMQEIWSVSRFTRDRLASWSGYPPERIHIVPNTLEPEMTSAAGPSPAESMPKPLVLTVSRLDARERYKHIDALIQAMAGLNAGSLLIVGDGSDRSRLEKLAAQSGLARRVHFAGQVSGHELARAYQACDLFALPSTGEGFGIVFLEAMAHGKACIGARAGGIPDVIDDGVTGTLVPPDSSDGLRHALGDLLTHADKRRSFGEAGRRRWMAEFDFAKFVRRVADRLALSVPAA